MASDGEECEERKRERVYEVVFRVFGRDLVILKDLRVRINGGGGGESSGGRRKRWRQRRLRCRNLHRILGEISTIRILWVLGIGFDFVVKICCIWSMLKLK